MPTTPITMDTTVVAGENQISRDIRDEAVILGNGTYFGLNSVGARVWSLIREPRAVEEICTAIEREYDVDSETCRRDVVELLERLADEKLIRITG